MIHIAIIGSGPSGCYTADYLAKKLDNAHIDIFDQHPTPFGLVRNGVAPDHLVTKNIVHQLEKAFTHPNVRFVGGVRIQNIVAKHDQCASITTATLEKHYDIIVLATGATNDRHLAIPGESLGNVFKSGEFAAWYNGDMTSRLHPNIGQQVAIIGHGNVALDIARLLAKSREQLLQSDMPATIIDSFTQLNWPRDIFIIGRGGFANAHFTPAMLSEIINLPNVDCYRSEGPIPDSLPADVISHIPKDQHRNRLKNLELLNQIPTISNDPLNEMERTSAVSRITFVFDRTPLELKGDQTITSVRLSAHTHEGSSKKSDYDLPVDTLITAIGFDKTDDPLQFNQTPYAVGWCKNGAKGVIQSNRVDAVSVAREIISAVQQSVPSDKLGYRGIKECISEQNTLTTSFNDWLTLDQHEKDAAKGSKPREKLITYAELCDLLISP